MCKCSLFGGLCRFNLFHKNWSEYLMTQLMMWKTDTLSHAFTGRLGLVVEKWCHCAPSLIVPAGWWMERHCPPFTQAPTVIPGSLRAPQHLGPICF